MLKMNSSTGCFVTDGCLPFKDATVTVRSEDSNEYKTISFSVDNAGIMIMIRLNPEVENQLKELLGVGRKKK